MSRTIRGEKPPHFEYWGRRLGNRYGASDYGRSLKKTTSGRERTATRNKLKKDYQ